MARDALVQARAARKTLLDQLQTQFDDQRGVALAAQFRERSVTLTEANNRTLALHDAKDGVGTRRPSRPGG